MPENMEKTLESLGLVLADLRDRRKTIKDHIKRITNDDEVTLMGYMNYIALLETEIEAVEKAIGKMQHSVGDPLTLEQLRDMDGLPVWIEHCNPKYNHIWLIWRNSKEDDIITGFEGYGEFWRAYAYPPAHINLEAWTAEWEGSADGYADGELVYDTWTCPECGHTEDTDDQDLLPDFCPSCGLAMTDKAREILRKRARGEHG